MVKKMLAVVVCVLAVRSFAAADAVRGISGLDFVTIGNPGNSGDTGRFASPYGCGAVGYEYHMGKYEVTNAQWNAFVLAAGAPTGYDGFYDAQGWYGVQGWCGAYRYNAVFTGPQQPTNKISWFEAAQFCNYLTSGDKSKGAYLFSGDNVNPGSFIGINRATAGITYGTIYVIPTEDEWYKAAYFQGSWVNCKYYMYPTSTDGWLDNRLFSPDPGNSANFFGGPFGTPPRYTMGYPNLTNVGEFENSSSPYGTFDQGGNVWEWTETLNTSSCRIMRGGSYMSGMSDLGSYAPSGRNPGLEGIDTEDGGFGFRVAYIFVPEPCSLALLTLGGLALGRKRR